MSLLEFAVSINKISFFVFLITLSVLVYEIYLFNKEKNKKKDLVIPKFDDKFAKGVNIVNKTSEKNNLNASFFKLDKKKYRVVYFLAIFLVLFGWLSYIGNLNYKNKKITPTNGTQVTPIEKEVSSKGIKVFDNNFNDLSDEELSSLKSEADIIIGIQTIKGLDIDKARIRVNKLIWEVTDITNDFNEKKDVFFIKYKLASSQANLKIEAQLHSKKNGWLAD